MTAKRAALRRAHQTVQQKVNQAQLDGAYWWSQVNKARVRAAVAEQLLTQAPADSKWARTFRQQLMQAAHAVDRCTLYAQVARFRA